MRTLGKNGLIGVIFRLGCYCNNAVNRYHICTVMKKMCYKHDIIKDSLFYRLMKQPALLAPSVDEAARGVQSEFNVWYLDDAALEDSPERVCDDLVVLLERLRAIGLEVNGSKCELTILNDSMPEVTEALFRGLFPGVRVVEACDLSLLGAPVDIQGITGTINEKREALERMSSKLDVLNPNQAFVFLKDAFAIPKLQYVLRASPAYLCREELRIFDRLFLI